MLQTHDGPSWTHLELEPATEDRGGGPATVGSPQLWAGSGVHKSRLERRKGLYFFERGPDTIAPKVLFLLGKENQAQRLSVSYNFSTPLPARVGAQ